MNDVTAYVSLGGNMGEENVLFPHALDCMDTWYGISVKALSGIYKTEPQGDRNQPWFANQVAALSCASPISPWKLLTALLNLETKLGRIRNETRRFGPRRIDLDLLLFGDIVVTDAVLTLPHPRMAERAFVLVPLLEITPNLAMPDGRFVAQLLDCLPHTVMDNTIYQ